MPEQKHTWAIYAALAIAGGLALKSFFGGLFGHGDDGGTSTPGGSSNPGGDQPPAPETDVPPTLTAVQAGILADQIEAAIWGTSIFGDWTEDEDLVIAAITQCQNDADVRVLMNAYGLRGSILDKLNLPNTVDQYLSASDIAAINADFAGKGIKLRF